MEVTHNQVVVETITNMLPQLPGPIVAVILKYHYELYGISISFAKEEKEIQGIGFHPKNGDLIILTDEQLCWQWLQTHNVDCLYFWNGLQRHCIHNRFRQKNDEKNDDEDEPTLLLNTWKVSSDLQADCLYFENIETEKSLAMLVNPAQQGVLLIDSDTFVTWTQKKFTVWKFKSDCTILPGIGEVMGGCLLFVKRLHYVVLDVSTKALHYFFFWKSLFTIPLSQTSSNPCAMQKLPNGEIIVGFEDGMLQIVSLIERKVVKILHFGSPIKSVLTVPNGNVAFLSEAGNIVIWK